MYRIDNDQVCSVGYRLPRISQGPSGRRTKFEGVYIPLDTSVQRNASYIYTAIFLRCMFWKIFAVYKCYYFFTPQFSRASKDTAQIYFELHVVYVKLHV